MPPDDERDYEVGYGKPPRHTRFVKGQSGNPRGRPPGAKNMKTLLTKALNELVLVFKQRGGSHRNNVQLGRFGRNRSNVWHYPGANSFARHGEEGNLLALHPTVKPVALVADAILDGSARGDIVLDAFLGSGTTVIAAERTGRRCNALELDPGYVDTAIRRWQTLTGDQARHAGTGRYFDDLVREAEAANAA